MAALSALINFVRRNSRKSSPFSNTGGYGRMGEYGRIPGLWAIARLYKVLEIYIYIHADGIDGDGGGDHYR